MCSGMSGTDLNHEGREDHEGNEKAPVFTEAGRKAFSGLRALRAFVVDRPQAGVAAGAGAAATAACRRRSFLMSACIVSVGLAPLLAQ